MDLGLWCWSIPVHADPVREHGGGSLTGDSEGKIQKTYVKRDVKMPCKWVCVSIGAPLGNPEVIYLLGLLSEKVGISGFLSWTQRALRF